MPAPKPSSVADWDTSLLNLLAPSGGQIASGWTTGQVVPSEWLNWWMNLVGQWTDYLNDLTNETLTWNVLQTFAAGISVSQSSANVDGVSSTGNGSGVGVRGIGGGLNGTGGLFFGGATDGTAVSGTGSGMGFGGAFFGGNSDSPGVSGLGGNTNGPGGTFSGKGTGPGVIGANTHTGPGGQFSGNATRPALHLVPQATPSTPANGDIWVDLTTNLLQAMVNGNVEPVAGQPSPTAMSGFTNGWAAGTPAPQFWISNGGHELELGGQLATGGVTNAAFFTLPVGFRPSSTKTCIVADLGGSVSTLPRLLSINSSGVCSITVGSGFLGAVSLDNVKIPLF